MGLDTASAKFLCAAKSLGVDFSCTAMLGRQAFYPDLCGLRRIFAIHGIRQDAEHFLRENHYAEEFFRCLGANEIASLDYSPYEGATIIHDMNAPIPDELRGRFTVVHDGGTLEHVFNVPQALKNCMEMVRVGGHFTQVNVANNFMGHGFWQFSPELVFRAFSPANGYRIVAVLLHEVVRGGAWYAVRDPDEVQSRVELCNRRPTYILTVAKRTAPADIFALPPQQSDYVAQWRSSSGDSEKLQRSAENARPRGKRGHVLVGVKRTIKGIRQRIFTRADRTPQRAFNRPYYRRIHEDAILRGQLE